MPRPRLLSCIVLALVAGSVSADSATRSFDSEHGTVVVSEVAKGLEHPWALTFLPDGRMLVTERPGRMRLVTPDGRVSAPLKNVPEVHARGQGGLLDVVLAPDYAKSKRIYFSYAEPRGQRNGTAIAHARLTDDAIEDVIVIFRQRPDWEGQHHYGSRLVFDDEGRLYATLGERNTARGAKKDREAAQSLENHFGKVVRIHADGSIPADNPYAGKAPGEPEIWSYGHRNPQGAALHPQTGALWVNEHGPMGGDEINLARTGVNYGWPVITYGRDYSGARVGDGITEAPGMAQPLHYWVPSIAPSGMAFYSADRFAPWQGNLFVGSLKFGQLVRLELDGERIVHEERLLEGLNRRVRDVRLGPDGWLYLLTDEADGRVLRVGLNSS